MPWLAHTFSEEKGGMDWVRREDGGITRRRRGRENSDQGRNF